MQLKKAALAAATALFFLSACATRAPQMTAETKHQRAQALKLRRDRAERAQELKERNMVLETRKKLFEMTNDEAPAAGDTSNEHSTGTHTSRSPETVVRVAPNLPQQLPSKLPSKLSVVVKPALAVLPPTPIAIQQEQTGEHYLYSKILETYASKNALELDRTVALLMKSYPDSVFADNAIFLGGKLALETGDQKKALQVFDRVLQDYPRSNKAVAALFAKASIQKRLGHSVEAKREFLQVRDLYPGSPEAARVSVELQLLETTKKRRES